MRYPKIEDDNFYEKIYKLYKKHEIKNQLTFNDICFPKKYELQSQQKLLAEYMNSTTPYENLLIYHQIGSGKTCTAIQIAEQWRNKRKIVIILPASLRGNFRNELRTNCVSNNYITQKDKDMLKTLHPSSREYKKIIDTSNNNIDKYYTILSYNKFIDYVAKHKLKNMLIIIDEIQNMISEDGVYYNTLKDALEKSVNIKLIVMSATPMFDKPTELALLLNLLKRKEKILLPIGVNFYKKFIDLHYKNNKLEYSTKNLDELKVFAKGLVSYYRGAPPYVYPEKIFKRVKCIMSPLQYRAYNTVVSNDVINNHEFKVKLYEQNAIKNLPNNFFIGSRMMSNVVFPNMKVNDEGFKSFKNTAVTNNLSKYSIKFYKILKRIKSVKAPIFVYSNFKEYGGIKSFQKVLDFNGYKNYMEHGEGKHRYAIWSSDETTLNRDELRDVYNNINNKNGEKLKIILGTPAIKEGVSLLRVKQIHILEPTWNWSKLDQIMGRGVRFCSHKDLPKDERKVNIYIYIASSPNGEETTDEYIFNMAIEKRKLISQFEHVLKEIAIDCKLFNMANYYPKIDEETLICSK